MIYEVGMMMQMVVIEDLPGNHHKFLRRRKFEQKKEKHRKINEHQRKFNEKSRKIMDFFGKIIDKSIKNHNKIHGHACENH